MLWTFLLLVLTGQGGVLLFGGVEDDYYETIVTCFGTLVFLLHAWLLFRFARFPRPQTALYAIAAGVLVPLLLEQAIGFAQRGYIDWNFAWWRFVFILLSSLAGYAVVHRTRRAGVAATAATVLLVGLFCRYALPSIDHYQTYGNMSAEREETLPAANWTFYNEKGDTLRGSDYRDKLLVLDFWFSRCASCFKKFPVLQKLHDKYKDNPKVAVLAVNHRIDEDADTTAFHLIRARDFDFPVVVQADREAPGIIAYPTVLILNKNKIIFRGSIDEAEPFLSQQLQK